MRKRRIIKRITALFLTAASVFLIGQGSPAFWAGLGNRIALLAVGLQKPEGGAAALSAQLQAKTAAATPATTAPAPTTAATTGETTAPTDAVQADSANVTRITLPSLNEKAPEKAADAGVVSEQKISSGSDPVEGVCVRNRSGKTLDIAAALTKTPDIHIDRKSDQPQVLIVHTHTTEGYLTYDAGFYNPTDVERTQDHTKNICAAGESIAKALRAAGIATLHDTTVHDYPKYTGAYSRSEQTVKAAMEKYPTVKVVLDVHRDAMIANDTHTKPTVTVNGQKAAQMMIIAGVVSTAALPHPNWEQNFRFAVRLQQSLATTYPDLMRPLSLVASRYNQHLANGYLLVEIGTDVNTVSEAVYSGEMLGKTLANLLNSNWER